MKKNFKFKAVITLCLVIICYCIYLYPQNINLIEKNENTFSTFHDRKLIDPGLQSAMAHKSLPLPKETRVTPGLTRQILGEIYKISDITVRATKSGEAIKALCLAGFPKEAWSLILEDSGFVRNRQLIEYFASADLAPFQFCEKYASLRGNGEAQLSLNSWLGNFDPAEVISILALDKGNPDLLRARDSDSELFSSGVATYLHGKLYPNNYEQSEAIRNLQQENLLNVASSLLKSGVLHPSSVDSFLGVVKFDDPFKKWNYINSISNPATEPFLDGQGGRSETISQMVASNAAGTVEKFKTLDNAFYLNKAMESWVSLDSTQARTWYTSNKAKLNPYLQSAAVKAFFQAALNYRELESAQSWAQEIQDGEQKQSALNAIAEVVATSTPKP